MIDARDADDARSARAKGLTEAHVVRRHVLRNCLNGVLATTGLQVGLLFASLAVIEQVFSWPGIGSYVDRSVAETDLPAIMGFALVSGALYVITNAVVDILQGIADPRIVLGRASN